MEGKGTERKINIFGNASSRAHSPSSPKVHVSPITEASPLNGPLDRWNPSPRCCTEILGGKPCLTALAVITRKQGLTEEHQNINRPRGKGKGAERQDLGTLCSLISPCCLPPLPRRIPSSSVSMSTALTKVLYMAFATQQYDTLSFEMLLVITNALS